MPSIGGPSQRVAFLYTGQARTFSVWWQHENHLESLVRAKDALFHGFHVHAFFVLPEDEWLTDAIVIPAMYEERAISAFHDSGYGAHLGAHKTECAMREHVWFPKMKQKVRTYCDNCGACKTAKAFKRRVSSSASTDW